jgi:hypothetical protein
MNVLKNMAQNLLAQRQSMVDKEPQQICKEFLAVAAIDQP